MRTLLILFILASSNARAESKPPPEKMPTCVRPKDFANGKFVASYESCLKRQDQFCGIHKENKECLALPPLVGKPYYKTTTDDIDPSKRCKIEKDESYKCLQDPVRIIPAVEETKAIVKPAETPSQTPGAEPGPKGALPSIDETGSNSGEQSQVMPPPPPPRPK